MPTIQDIISRVDEIKINPYSEAAKTAWISQVEGWIKDKLMPAFNYFEISRKKDQAAYDVPDGVNFTNIIMAYMDRYPIQKLDARSFNKTGYFLDAAGKLNIYPVPSQDDPVESPGLRFIHKVPHVAFKYPADKDVVLIVPAPYDKVYEDYIYAMIDWNNREYEAYNNEMAMYNASWSEVERWAKKINPLPASQIRNMW